MNDEEDKRNLLDPVIIGASVPVILLILKEVFKAAIGFFSYQFLRKLWDKWKGKTPIDGK